MKNAWFRNIAAASLVALVAGAAHGADNYWTGPAAGSWNNGASWSGGVPIWDATAWITNTGAQTITNGLTDTAWSLYFTNANHTLLGGNLWLGSGLINVAGGRSATISSSLAGKTGLTKTGGGTLTLGNNTNLITGGITINAGTVDASGANRVALGNNAITLNGGGLNLGNNTTAVYLREFGGSSAVTAVILSLNISSLNDTTYSGASSGVALGSTTGGWGIGLIKGGPGTLSITGGKIQIRTDRGGLQLGRGGLIVGGNATITEVGPTLLDGTLTLDETAGDLDRVGDTLAITLGGGGNSRLRYLGQASTASAETVGNLNIADTASYGPRYVAIDVRPGSGGTASVTFASIAAQTPSLHIGLLNFTTGGGNAFGTDARVLVTSAPALRNSVLPGGIVNGTDFATYESATPKGVMAFGSAGSGTSYTNPTNVNDPAATSTVLIDTNTTTLALTANKRYNALKIDGARTIDLGTFTLSVGSSASATDYMSGLILKTGAGQAEIISSSAGTAGLFNSGNQDVVNNFSFYVNEGVLRVTAPFRTTGNGAVRVQKAGAGVLWLEPVAAYQGTSGQTANGLGIYFSEGVIRMNPSLGGVGTSSRFANYPMRLAGGVMEITDGITYNPTIGTAAANLNWITSGGFAAFGSNATFQPNIAWGTASHIPNGAALLLNSTTADRKITLSGTLNLGTSATAMFLREIEVADNPNSTTDLAEISGQIISDTTAAGGGSPTYTYHLVKTGAGTLSLTHNNNNYSGATYIKAGTLAINGTLAAPASTEVARNPEYTAVNVMTNGTLGGTGTINRVVRIDSGGTLSPGNSTGILTIGADTSLTNAATLRLEINGLTEGTQHDQLKLTAGDLVISNSTLSLEWGGSFTVSNPTNIWIVNNAGGGLTLGQFAGLADNASVGTHNGAEWFITYDGNYSLGLNGGNDIVLYTVIPEPSALTLVGFGLLGVWVLGRARRRA